jgi:four helix bundle protein
MTKIRNSKQYDLEDRSLAFAKNVRSFVKKLKKTLSNIEDCKQLVRSSGSVGANYIEANEALGKKDFIMHIKICRKEAKESQYWLRLIDLDGKSGIEEEREVLAQEAKELTYIFGSILQKSK